MDQATYQHVWDQIRPISMFVRANIIRKPANHLVLGASTSKRSCPMLHSIWPTDNSGANREKGCSSLQLNGPPGRLLSQAAILLQFSYKGCEVLQLRSGFRDHQLLEKTGPCFMERWNGVGLELSQQLGDNDLSEKMTCAGGLKPSTLRTQCNTNRLVKLSFDLKCSRRVSFGVWWHRNVILLSPEFVMHLWNTSAGTPVTSLLLPCHCKP